VTGFTEIAAAGPLLTAFGVCVLAGLVSFASPCVVPLVPGYLSYLAAVVGVEEEPRLGSPSGDRGLALRTARLRVAGAALLFVAGFTVVFVLGTVAVLGMTTTLISNQLLLQRIGGVITIVMGLVFVGFIPALQREARFTPRQISTLGGAPLLGAVFGLDRVRRSDAVVFPTMHLLSSLRCALGRDGFESHAHLAAKGHKVDRHVLTLCPARTMSSKRNCKNFSLYFGKKSYSYTY